MTTNGNVNFQEDSAQQASQSNQGTNQGTNLGKDEIGWYFVEQFYTTMSKSPEKLHLFYSKRSQFVNGVEAEVTPVSVGREAIKERIKKLDFQECKVRVTNVDSQASEDNIVIQVIGELSNKQEEPKKFAQTFLLAKQPSGYFVLNDIVRYIDENVEEEQETATEEPPAGPAVADIPKVEETKAEETEVEPEVVAPKTEDKVQEVEAPKLDTAAVDEKLETVRDESPDATEPAAETPVEVQPTVLETKEEKQSEAVVPTKATEEVKEEDKKVETPKEPAPTPAAPKAAAPQAATAPAEAEKPKEPPKPMTWASMASRMAGNAAATVKAAVPAAVPLPKVVTQAAAQAQKAAAPPAAQVPKAAAQVAEAVPASKDAKDDEWQSVGGADSKRQNRPVSTAGAGTQGPGQEGAMAYIKFVNDKVKSEDLKAELSKFGELVYFDIHRQKNCAFAEYSSPTGYQAAVAANPHTVNGENIVVEQRRPKAGAFGSSSYGRGPAGGRGRGGALDGQRTNSQGAGRGGFTQQARGGGRGGAARGGARPAARASS